MKLENQVVSLELAKKLKELGVEQESLFYWHDNEIKTVTAVAYPPSGKEFYFDGGSFENNLSVVYSAYTVAELGEMLPRSGIEYHKCVDVSGGWSCGQSFPSMVIKKDDKEADARAKMLIYLKENNLIN